MDFDKLTQQIETIARQHAKFFEVANSKNTQKAAICFYSIVKHAYSLLKEKNCYKEGKEKTEWFGDKAVIQFMPLQKWLLDRY